MNLWGKTIPLFLALALLGMGCGVAKTPSHPQTIQPAMMTVTVAIPSLTPNPSATPTPELTAEAPLKTNGPYLAYLRGADADHAQLILMDADGKGRKVIDAPSENPLYTRFLSPDGKWLAYYAGSAQKEKASDLELDLLNLETGQTKVVSKLLSKDYPDNFVQAAKEIRAAATPNTIDAYVTDESLKDVFLSGITSSLGWSPDGKYLAFAGQMDGLSSDVYLYDIAKGSIRRLSKDPQEIQEIAWSPNGKWIISSSTTYFGEGGGYDEDAISFDNFTIKSLPYRVYGRERRWYNDHAYIINSGESGIGNFNIQSIDVATGVVRKIWGGAFHFFAFDPEQGLAIFSAVTREWPEPDNSNFVPGFYLVDIKTGRKTSVNPDGIDLSFFGLGNRRFFSSYGNEAHFIAADGSLIPADPNIQFVSVAPDKQHWIGIGKTLKVFNADDSLASDIDLPFIPPSASYDFHMLWKPDSSGLFIIFGTEIYRVDIQNKEINLVEGNLLPYQDLNFISIPAK